MIVTTRVLPVVLALLSVGVVNACKSPPATPPQPVVDTAAVRQARDDSIAAENQRRAAEAAAARQRAIADSVARARAAEEAARRDADMMRSTITQVINFDFDKSDIRTADAATLDAKIPLLMANSDVMLRVSGHADERGSSEYNLALGQRRAAAAKRYLVTRGVADSRVETTSFGEERPLCTDHNEACWSQNRRDEFEITAGGTTLRRP